MISHLVTLFVEVYFVEWKNLWPYFVLSWSLVDEIGNQSETLWSYKEVKHNVINSQLEVKVTNHKIRDLIRKNPFCPYRPVWFYLFWSDRSILSNLFILSKLFYVSNLSYIYLNPLLYIFYVIHLIYLHLIYI
jgi:hypothetical protein